MDSDAIQRRSENLDAAYIQLKEQNAELDIQQMIKFDKARRLKCTDKECSCYVKDEVVRQLTDLITENRWLFPPNLVASRNNNRERPDDPPTLIEPQFEKATEKLNRTFHSRVRIPEVKNFFAELVRVFNEAQLDPANRLPHRLPHCDCVNWLCVTFPRVRQKTFEILIKDIFGHNILVVAIFCFALNNQLDSRAELAEMRSHIMMDGNQDFWILIRKLLAKNWTRDRVRNLRNFRPDQVAVTAKKYSEIISQLGQRFPRIIDQKLNLKDVIDQADPGPLFKCHVCKSFFPESGAIICSPLAANEAVDRHSICRSCYRIAVSVIIKVDAIGVKKLSERRMAIPCSIDDCKNEIVICSTAERFLNRETRRLLKARIVLQLVEQLGHTTSEGEDCPTARVTT